jgi:hypothetical protein
MTLDNLCGRTVTLAIGADDISGAFTGILTKSVHGDYVVLANGGNRIVFNERVFERINDFDPNFVLVFIGEPKNGNDQAIA